MTNFRITPEGPFSLEASTRFLEGFAPAAYHRAEHPNHLDLAFPVEAVWQNTVAVCLRQTSNAVVGEISEMAIGRSFAGKSRAFCRSMSMDRDSRS